MITFIIILKTIFAFSAAVFFLLAACIIYPEAPVSEEKIKAQYIQELTKSIKNTLKFNSLGAVSIFISIFLEALSHLF